VALASKINDAAVSHTTTATAIGGTDNAGGSSVIGFSRHPTTATSTGSGSSKSSTDRLLQPTTAAVQTKD
jgi:hypothetical protein